MKVVNNSILYVFLLIQLYRPLLTKILIGLLVADILLLLFIATTSPASLAKALAIMEEAQREAARK